MSSSDRGRERPWPGGRSDREFERALLDSARADAPPAGQAPEAWSKLAATLSLIAPPSSSPSPSPFPSRTAAARWLLLGALGGSAVTAAWMGSRHDRPGSAVTPPAASAPRVPPPVEPPASPAPPLPPPSRASGAVLARAHGPARARPAGASVRQAPGAEAPSAALAAEVAALDAARAAAAAGRPGDTLRLVNQYRYDFPDGQLAADAEVVAIEALAARGDHAEAARLAARFLARYPDDPHGDEVRRLAGP